jgi:glycosyltransferase involved in cell wall biosynthesis
VTEVLAESGAGVVVPRDRDAFAEALGRLLDDPAAADALGASGRRFAEERLSWRGIVSRQIAPLLA